MLLREAHQRRIEFQLVRVAHDASSMGKRELGNPPFRGDRTEREPRFGYINTRRTVAERGLSRQTEVKRHTLGQKSQLFCGYDRGNDAPRLIVKARINGGPQRRGWPMSSPASSPSVHRLDELLLWNWTPQHQRCPRQLRETHSHQACTAVAITRISMRRARILAIRRALVIVEQCGGDIAAPSGVRSHLAMSCETIGPASHRGRTLK